MLKIYGVPFSAHTRKVVIAATEKNLAFEFIRVIPLQPPPGWQEKSPLGLIPVIEDGEITLADSSVIGLYLERCYPQQSLYPADTAAYARALWIEEFVDGGLAPHVLRGLLRERVFAPRFLQQAPDEELIRKSLTEMIPPRLAYLEHTLQGEYFAGTSFSVADIAVASLLINFHYAGESLQAQSYPKLYRYFHQVLARDSFRKAFRAEIPAASAIEGLDMRLFATLEV
jgi:glutathione S-transferase